jgi:hypothetical protein
MFPSLRRLTAVSLLITSAKFRRGCKHPWTPVCGWFWRSRNNFFSTVSSDSRAAAGCTLPIARRERVLRAGLVG